MKGRKSIIISPKINYNLPENTFSFKFIFFLNQLNLKIIKTGNKVEVVVGVGVGVGVGVRVGVGVGVGKKFQ